MIYYERGEHVVRIESQGWTETKEKGHPMLVFEALPLQRVTKDHEGNEQFEEVCADANFPTRTLRVVVDASSEQSMEFALKKLRYAGFDGDSFADLDLRGVECRAICDHTQYKGKDRENWDFALPPLERGAVNDLDRSTARRLDAIFGKRLKEGAKPAPTPAARQPEPSSQPAQQTVPNEYPYPDAPDDVPF